NGDLVSEKDGTLASFTGGPLDGRHRTAFLDKLDQMRRLGLDHILIEASGSADPTAILDALAAAPGIEEGVVLALVDARALELDFAHGRGLLEKTAEAPALLLLQRQLQAADVLALSKTDLVEDSALEEILRNLALLNPAAALTVCTYGQLDDRLLKDRGHAFRAAPPTGGGPLTPEACDIGTTVIRDSRPLHPQRFYDLYRERLGLGIFRTKGFLWLASRPDDVLLWNQAGGTMGFELLGTWRAAILANPGLLPEERQQLEGMLADGHPVFGDRSCELTVIGTKRDREVFCGEFQAAFCTGEEVAAWQAGEAFPDPWATTLRRVP
ncbi:MAG: GTP-binding protein, partial [Verrucomicrobiota bacterium]